MEGIYLIFVMIVTGGAIAFIGDKLGTKIGKKRLSIFGLRPRHTSMVVTVLTGGLITALSIGFMALISQNVRTALFGMDELRQTMNSTLTELDEVTENLFKAQTEFERANENLRESKEEIVSLKGEQEQLRTESDRLKKEGEHLKSTNASLTEVNENLSSTNAALESDNKKLSEFNVTLTADNEKLSSANEKLIASNNELEEHNNRLRDGIIAIREGDITLRVGEILASGIIKPARTTEEISADIKQIADRASETLIKRFGRSSDDTVWFYQPELNAVIEQIASAKNDMVLKISAAGNLVRGESVRARLEVYPNHIIFNKGEKIFSKTYTISETNPLEIILQDFLTEVNQIATQSGILADPLTGGVGLIEGMQIYEVLDALTNVEGSVELTAFARDDTDSQGPLRLTIKVEQR